MEGSSDVRSGQEGPDREKLRRARLRSASAKAGARRSASSRAEPAATSWLGMAEYVERQPFGALFAAAMTGYAIAWYLRGGARLPP